MSAEEQREADLARLISGELDADSDAGKAALSAAGMSADELDGLRQLALRLDRVANDRELNAAQSEEMEEVPGADRVASTIEALAAESHRRRWGWLWPAAAILLMLPLFLVGNEEPREDDMLGDPAAKVQLVQDDGSRFGAVEIELLDTAQGTRIELRIFDAADSATDPAQRYTVEELRWSNPAEQQKWPTDVSIQIWVHRPGQKAVLVGSVESSSD